MVALVTCPAAGTGDDAAGCVLDGLLPGEDGHPLKTLGDLVEAVGRGRDSLLERELGPPGIRDVHTQPADPNNHQMHTSTGDEVQCVCHRSPGRAQPRRLSAERRHRFPEPVEVVVDPAEFTDRGADSFGPGRNGNPQGLFHHARGAEFAVETAEPVVPVCQREDLAIIA